MTVKELMMLLLAEMANGYEDYAVSMMISDDYSSDGFRYIPITGISTKESCEEGFFVNLTGL